MENQNLSLMSNHMVLSAENHMLNKNFSTPDDVINIVLNAVSNGTPFSLVSIDDGEGGIIGFIRRLNEGGVQDFRTIGCHNVVETILSQTDGTANCLQFPDPGEKRFVENTYANNLTALQPFYKSWNLRFSPVRFGWWMLEALVKSIVGKYDHLALLR